MTPETRYAKTGDLHIAYQVVGDGPVDIVFVPEFWHTIEVQWDQPELAAFLERLASFGRLISFDQRGSGVSDPVSLDELPSIEQWMDDVRVVMDDVGSKSAVLISIGGGGTMSMLFAATHPERAAGLVLVNSFARLSRAPDYPAGRGPEIEDEVRNVMRAGWGRGEPIGEQPGPGGSAGNGRPGHGARRSPPAAPSPSGPAPARRGRRPRARTRA